MTSTSVFGYTKDGAETIYTFPLYFTFSLSSKDGILSLEEKIFYTEKGEEMEVPEGRYFTSGFFQKFNSFISKGVFVYLDKHGEPSSVPEIIRAVENTCYKNFCRDSIVDDSCLLSRRSDPASRSIVESLAGRGFSLPEIDFRLSNDTIFDEVCTWQGLINWGPTLRSWMDTLNNLPSRNNGTK